MKQQRRQPETVSPRGFAFAGTSFAGGLLGSLLILLLPLSGQGQDPLACLEAQRALWQEAMEAAKDAREADAAEALGRVLALPHVVAPPFSLEADGRGRITERALAFRRAAAARSEKSYVSETAKAHGTACARCSSHGFTACTLCEGTGVRVVGRGRREHKEACPPIEQCSRCQGAGRVGDCTARTALLAIESLVEDFEKRGNGDVFSILGALPGKLDDLDAMGLTPDYEQSLALRRALAAPPFAVGNLSGSMRGEVRDLWKHARPGTRRHFLRGFGVELLAFRYAIEPLTRPLPTTSEATPVEAALLMIEPRAWQDKQVSVEATLSAAPVVSSWPLVESLVGVEEFDPALMMAFHLPKSERRRLEVAQQGGLLNGLRDLLKAHPSADVEQALAALEPGAKIVVTGRLVPLKTPSPSHALEIWSVVPKENAPR